VLFNQCPQFPEFLLRFGLREVFAVNPAKLVKAPSARCVATFFRIAECAEMDVIHPLLFDPSTQSVLREALFARQRQCPDIDQKVDADSLERGNEPINVGAFIANCVERGHGQINSNLMLCCSALVKVSLQAVQIVPCLPRLKRCGPERRLCSFPVCFDPARRVRHERCLVMAAKRDDALDRASFRQRRCAVDQIYVVTAVWSGATIFFGGGLFFFRAGHLSSQTIFHFFGK
jgi:hypothetical protein